MFFGISHGTLGIFQKMSAASLKMYRVILLMLSVCLKFPEVFLQTIKYLLAVCSLL